MECGLSFSRTLALLALAFMPLLGNAMPGEINNWINNAETGVLLMKSDSGEATAATTLNTEADIQITGPIARVTVTQRFRNQGADFVEGTYVFPLSERASVNAMELVVGERRIVGEIQEKAEAARQYAQAKAEGKRTALVEQRRPNVFTTSVANIAPNEEIAVQLEYIEVLAREGNEYKLRLPMTLTPRYRPELIEPGTGVAELREGEVRSSAMPEVSGVFADRGELPADSHHARIRIRLHGGVHISQLYSRSHQILSKVDGGQFDIAPRDLSVPMDRDFLLSWTLSPEREAEAVLFSENVAGEDYSLLMLVPPVDASSQPRLPREMLFIIDTSGSMGGESIRQAKAALQAGLKRLYPGDRFNIIEFNSEYRSLFPAPVAVSRNTAEMARRFVGELDAGGGTEMLAPLRAALSVPSSESYLRQLVFITDGAVSSEQAIFKLLHSQLGSARLFTVGIGSAPNSYFMRKSAEFGRGSFTYINKVDDVEIEMSDLFSRLERPLVRDIELVFPDGVQVEMFPAKIPDLYAGEPVMVAMRHAQLPEWITVRGQGETSWEQRIASINSASAESGISSLWARQKIEALMDRMTLGEAEAVVRPEVIEVSLRHSILSAYTSFVAVDHTPVRSSEQALKQEQIANRLPEGLAWPSTATGVERLWWMSAALLLVSLVLMWRVGRMRHV